MTKARKIEVVELTQDDQHQVVQSVVYGGDLTVRRLAHAVRLCAETNEYARKSGLQGPGIYFPTLHSHIFIDGVRADEEIESAILTAREGANRELADTFRWKDVLAQL